MDEIIEEYLNRVRDTNDNVEWSVDRREKDDSRKIDWTVRALNKETGHVYEVNFAFEKAFLNAKWAQGRLHMMMEEFIRDGKRITNS